MSAACRDRRFCDSATAKRTDGNEMKCSAQCPILSEGCAHQNAHARGSTYSDRSAPSCMPSLVVSQAARRLHDSHSSDPEKRVCCFPIRAITVITRHAGRDLQRALQGLSAEGGSRCTDSSPQMCIGAMPAKAEGDTREEACLPNHRLGGNALEPFRVREDLCRCSPLLPRHRASSAIRLGSTGWQCLRRSKCLGVAS